CGDVDAELTREFGEIGPHDAVGVGARRQSSRDANAWSTGCSSGLQRDRSAGRLEQATGLAAAVDLEPVALDLVAGGLCQVARQRLHVALAEVLDAAAFDADEVVVMAAGADAIVQGPIIEHDATDDVEVEQELHGAKDR